MWQMIHDKLSMELGSEELSPRTYLDKITLAGQIKPHLRFWTLDFVCRNFVLASYDGFIPADRFMKERLSFIEIAFRERAEKLEAKAAGGNKVAQVLADQEKLKFRAAVDELNARMRQAGYELHYHNGFIQRSTDQIVEGQIEEPFWDLVSDAPWENVDVDMKEAIDRRDNSDRDSAFYAARVLESTIKDYIGHKRMDLW